jgi:hypothetical protein
MTETIEREFKRRICEGISVEPEGLNRYRVFTPFQFDDGDHLAILLHKRENRWTLTDEGHTFMHLTYELDEKDLYRGTRRAIIDGALSAFAVEEHDGELSLPVPDERYGDALYSFVQALLKVTDVTFLSRERVRSTFLEDFQAFMVSASIPASVDLDWHDPGHDPEGMYAVDCRVNTPRTPVFVYALPNDGRVRDATIGLLQFERWGVPHRSLGIFENQEEINRKVLARFSDVCEKQFSSLTANRERIIAFLAEAAKTA